MELFPFFQGAIAAHLMCDPFYSGRQQSLEILSLTVTLVAYHLGILLKAGGKGSQSDGIQFFFSALQYVLNAGVMWRFFSCIFKDMLLVGYPKRFIHFKIIATVVVAAMFLTSHELSGVRPSLKETIKSKVASAKEKFQVEDDVRKDVVHGELLTMRPQIQALHPRMADELKTAFNTGRLRDTIAQAEVPDLWMKHVQLSVNLEMLRNNWRHVKKKTGQTALKNKGLNELANRWGKHTL